jgi:hypothetical protein
MGVKTLTKYFFLQMPGIKMPATIVLRINFLGKNLESGKQTQEYKFPNYKNFLGRIIYYLSFPP